MKRSNSTTILASALAAIVATILLLVPFHAFLTVWLASLVGHYTLLRLWKEILLVPLGIGAVYVLTQDAKVRRQLYTSKLVRVIVLYLFVQLLWGIISYALHDVTAKALMYGWIVNARFLLFFLAAWVVATGAPKLKIYWPRLLVWPAALVVLFGLLQYFVLPYDVLKHAGYNTGTIFPYETINNNIHHLRIMSTLRGANPLGAYLVLVLSLVFARWQKHRIVQYAVLAVTGGLVLFLTFSRSAWLGLIVSIGILAWVGLKTARNRRVVSSIAIGAVIIMSGSLVLLRHNTAIQDSLFHTDDKSTIAKSSNQGHESALKDGLHDVMHEPLGRGPGTAGPASVYNNGKVRIAENYFVQIGQEVGWLGLVLFVSINGLVAKELWVRKQDSLALGLFAALAGLTLVNLLSHAWADDTLAYLWWGLAGIAVATPKVKTHEV
jgi:hypothetical protein